MNTQKLIALTAGAVFLFGAAGAHATSEVTVTYTTSTSNTQGNAPTITDDLASGFNITQTGGLGEQNFVTTTPAGSCGSGCTNDTAQDQINFDFTFTDNTGGTGTLDTDAVYYAKYDSPSIGCDNNGNSETDCIIWNGTGGSSTSFGNPSVTDAVTLSDGNIVDLTFYNAADWTISSEISGTYTLGSTGHQSSVPEPASMVLFASSLLGLPVIRRLRRKPAASATAAA
jgi:hypothetical protein